MLSTSVLQRTPCDDFFAHIRTRPYGGTIAHEAFSAAAKLVLLFQCRADGAFVPTYLAVVRPITRQIVLGLVLLLLSGIGFMAIGHSFTPRLVTKLALGN